MIHNITQLIPLVISETYAGIDPHSIIKKILQKLPYYTCYRSEPNSDDVIKNENELLLRFSRHKLMQVSAVNYIYSFVNNSLIACSNLVSS